MGRTTPTPETAHESAGDAVLKSPLRYPGGKSRVAKRLLEHAPGHADYREIFAGGAAMFFHKPLAQASWINDLHPGLYALYVTLRDDFDAFAGECRKLDGNRREQFDYWAFGRRDLMDAAGDGHLLERAVQFYYLNRTVWGGRVCFDPERKSRLYFSNPEGWNNIEKKLAHMARISRKLSGVKITNLDFEHCLAEATPGTFIYADPPYIRDTDCHATDKLYDKSFTFDCHARLADALTATPGKVMISYDDCDAARELYADPKWRFVELQWKYCGTYAVSKNDKAANRKEKKIDGQELLILNY